MRIADYPDLTCGPRGALAASHAESLAQRQAEVHFEASPSICLTMMAHFPFRLAHESTVQLIAPVVQQRARLEVRWCKRPAGGCLLQNPAGLVLDKGRGQVAYHGVKRYLITRASPSRKDCL